MKAWSRLSHICGVVALIVAVPLSACNSQATQSLEFKVSLENASTSVTLGEPVVAKLVLRNISSEEVEVEDFTYDNLLVFVTIRKPNGETFKILSPITEFTAKVKTLRPGEYYAHHWDLTVAGMFPALKTGRLEFVFSQPGRYAVVANYETLGISSNELTIEVLPVPPAEKEAFNMFFPQADPLLFLSGAGQRDASAIAQFEKLVEQFPNSIYAKYARYFIARYELKLGWGRTKSNPGKALQYLQQIDTKRAKFAFEFPAKLLMLQACEKIRDREKETGILDSLLRDFDPKNRSLTLPDMPGKDSPDFRARLKRRILKFY